MGVIVFHAGMPKTGSTNIQQWLAEHSDDLRARGIDCMRFTSQTAAGGVALTPVTRRNSAMSAFLVGDIKTRSDFTAKLCGALDAHATRGRTLVVSGESYEVLFNAFGREEALPHLNELADAHSLRVAYYVRPQHSWLESAWLQWGFRHVAPPDEWIRKQRMRIDYLDTFRVTREIAPKLSFEMRPFRRDLFDGGDVVRDFARVFLGLSDTTLDLSHERWSNRSLPLDAALLLRSAPTGLFWSSIHDNKTFYPLKEIILEWQLPDTDRARRAREILHRYAHATFEGGNQQLITELGWPTDSFIDPPDQGRADDSLSGLNDCWSASASEGECVVFYAALQALLAQRRATSARQSPTDRKISPQPAPAQRAARRLRTIARRVRTRVRPQPTPTVASPKQTNPSATRPAPQRAITRPSRRDDGDPRVVDVAPDVGLGLTTRTFGAVVFDYDGDGWPDIFLGRHDAPAYLFRNDHGSFSRVDSVRFPGRTDRHCAAAGDLTGDGRPDLFCVVGGDSGHGPKGTPNELWLQQPDGTFVNVGEQTGLADPYGRGREALLFDATGNGRLDIFVGNVSPRSDGKPSPNRLFLNEGGGVFRPAPELGLDLDYSVGGAGAPGSPHGGGNWPMGRLAAIDAEGNGWSDVIMVAKAPEDPFQTVHLFHNDAGSAFRDVSAKVGLSGVSARDLAVADMVGDGRPDLVIAHARGVSIYLNEHGKFRLGYELPIEHAFRVAVADADGDGRNDVYVMRTSSVPGPDIPDVLLVRTDAPLDFERIRLPTVPGTVRDDAVYAIDYDQDGRSEFLVLHGHSLHPAPIQLIAFR